MRSAQPVPKVLYRGQMDLPKRVQVTKSLGFSLTLSRLLASQGGERNWLLAFQKTGDRLTIRLDVASTDEFHELELDLDGPGCEITNPTQFQSLSEKVLHFDWSCWFSTSGEFRLKLTPRLRGPQRSRTFEAYAWFIKVYHFLGFTKQELYLCTIVTSVLAVMAVILSILVNVHSLHLFGF